MKNEDALKAMGATIHDLTTAMQSAFIEWQHGKGAEAAMGWIANTLAGPGLLPDEDATYGKDAQAWWDSNNSHPMPKCECGRPSNMVGGGVAGCCREHFEAAKNNRPNAEVTGRPLADGPVDRRVVRQKVLRRKNE